MVETGRRWIRGTSFSAGTIIEIGSYTIFVLFYLEGPFLTSFVKRKDFLTLCDGHFVDTRTEIEKDIPSILGMSSSTTRHCYFFVS